jgi:hypothetical protein
VDSTVAHWIYGEKIVALNIGLDLDDSQITEIVSKAIKEQIEAKFNDSAFLDKIQSVINQHVSNKLDQFVDSVDITDKINSKVEKVFESRLPSIDQQTTALQLTMMDDMVVNENEFVTKSLNVVESAVIEDLVVRGRVNTDNASWNELKGTIKDDAVKQIQAELTETITDHVLDRAKNGIDFDNVRVDGINIISNGALGAAITHSNLQKLGKLTDLTVQGATDLDGSLFAKNNRVGVNTSTPKSALDIWDDDINLSVGKRSKGVAKIHLSTGQLEIGTNADSQITIDPEGKVKITELMIGRNNIRWEKDIPNYQGQKGDIVFNMDPTSESHTGWQCLGGFRWRQF